MLVEIVAQQSRELHMRDTFILADSVVVLCDTLWQYYPHPLCVPLMYVPEVMPPLRDTTPKSSYTISTIRSNARRYILHNHPELYVSVSDTNRLKSVEAKSLRVQRAIVKDVEADILDAKRALRDLRSPWRKEANLALQVTQNYATENWQQGGVNAFSMLWNAKAFANYKKDNISWQNTAEWRVGISTVSGDTIHKMNTTDDVFQIYSKLGYQFHKKWYVTVFLDFRTNLFPSFQKNSNKVNTTFLTPIRYTMGAGIDYKMRPVILSAIHNSSCSGSRVHSGFLSLILVKVHGNFLHQGASYPEFKGHNTLAGEFHIPADGIRGNCDLFHQCLTLPHAQSIIDRPTLGQIDSNHRTDKVRIYHRQRGIDNGIVGSLAVAVYFGIGKRTWNENCCRRC